MVDQPGLRLGLGDSANYDGDADLVFTHIYGPLPKQLIGKPAIINVYGNKRAKAEAWCGTELREVSKWGRGLTNTLYSNFDPNFDVSDLVEEEFAPGRGWMPLELPARILQPFTAGMFSICDPFMGRGTIGKACKINGLGYVGIDRDPDRVALAREYLGC